MMAQDNQSDLARLERVERRLQALEDAEAIRNLKARYAALCDSQYDADGIAMLFTEDAPQHTGMHRGPEGTAISATCRCCRWRGTAARRKP